MKNADSLERMERIDTLVIDKTGTLTEGKPSVSAIITAEATSEDELLRLSAGVERASEHPLAAAIVAAAEVRKIAIPSVENFDSSSGKGALGTVGGRRVVLGNLSFVEEQGVNTAALASKADELRREGATAIFAAVDGKLAGVLPSPIR